MLEKKQIEEMSEEIASMLCEAYRPNCDEYQPHTCSYCYVNSTPIGCFAEMLYNAGYRKQEWISVDERLPEPNMLVLAILNEPCSRLNFPFEEQVLILLRERFPYSVGIVEEWRRPFSAETINYDGRVTHWMPLPEAPKMKGGAE